MRRIPLLTWADPPFVAGLAVLSLFLARVPDREVKATGIVVTSPGGSGRHGLAPGILEVAGRLGPSRLRIDPDLSVRFVASPCPNQVCITQGPIRSPGDVRACVPNHLLVEIAGTRPTGAGLDAVTR